MSELDIRAWDHNLGEWRTVKVEATPEPREASRRRRTQPGRAFDLDTLNQASPLPEAWRYTAYAPGDQLADTRSHLKPETAKTHRPAVTSWSAFRPAESDRSERDAVEDFTDTARRVFAAVTKGK